LVFVEIKLSNILELMERNNGYLIQENVRF